METHDFHYSDETNLEAQLYAKDFSGYPKEVVLDTARTYNVLGSWAATAAVRNEYYDIADAALAELSRRKR